MVSLRRKELSGRNRRDRVLDSELDPCAPTGPLEALLATLGIATCVCADEHHVGAGAVCDAQRLVDRVAVAHDEVAAPLAQRVTEVGERLQQEALPRGRPLMLAESVVEDEQRNDFRRDFDRGM
jgi:hypothetical protein